MDFRDRSTPCSRLSQAAISAADRQRPAVGAAGRRGARRRVRRHVLYEPPRHVGRGARRVRPAPRVLGRLLLVPLARPARPRRGARGLRARGRAAVPAAAARVPFHAAAEPWRMNVEPAMCPLTVGECMPLPRVTVENTQSRALSCHVIFNPSECMPWSCVYFYSCCS